MGNDQGDKSGYDRAIFGGGSGGTATATNVARGRRKPRFSLQAKMLVFTAVALLILGGAAYMFVRPKQKRYVLDNYQTAHVVVRDFRSFIVSAGRVVPDTTVDLKSMSSKARVQHVHVEAGDDVERGQLLVDLISDTLEDELLRAQAEADEAGIEWEQAVLKTAQDDALRETELADARSRLQSQEQHLALMIRLFEQGGVARKEVDEAEATVARQLQAIVAAEHALDFTAKQGELTRRKAEQRQQTAAKQIALLEEQQANLQVRSPAAGTVLEVSVRPGDAVSDATVLVKMADLSQQYVHSAVTPQQATDMSVGMTATLRIGNRSVPAEVVFVSPQAVAGTEGTSVPVRLRLEPHIARDVVPNTEVAVEIELGTNYDQAALPRGPFFTSGDAAFVYVVAADGKRATRQDVRFGAIDGTFVEVIAGLEPGDTIVYSSYSAFRAYPEVELLPEGGRKVVQ